MLTLSRDQYRDLCTECAGKMMSGKGSGGMPTTLPAFTGTDISFWVEDPALEGGGFMDTLSNTWNKVKSFVADSPLAQQVVKKGIAEGKKIARGVADSAVKAGIDYLPEAFRGPVEGLATQALDKLESKAEKAAESAIITPPSRPATVPTARVPAAPKARALPAAGAKRSRSDGAASSSKKRKRMRGAGHAAGLMGPEPFSQGGFTAAPAFDAGMMPSGASMVASTNSLQRVY
jgi:hypothetical protein